MIEAMEKTEVDDKILRDHLAMDRTNLANQRTLLAMIRTGLYFGVMGLTVMTLPALEELKPFAFVLYAVGIGFILTGLFNFKKMKKRISHSYQNIRG